MSRGTEELRGSGAACLPARRPACPGQAGGRAGGQARGEQRGGGNAPLHLGAEVDRLLVFAIGEEWYALDIHQAQGIEPVGPITPVPGTPPFVAGVYNLRGSLLAVIDTRSLLGLEASEEVTGAHIIVGKAGGFTGGLLVDDVHEILDVPRAEREPPISALEAGASSYISGQVHVNGHLVVILDLEQLFQAVVQE